MYEFWIPHNIAKNTNSYKLKTGSSVMAIMRKVNTTFSGLLRQWIIFPLTDIISID